MSMLELIKKKKKEPAKEIHAVGIIMQRTGRAVTGTEKCVTRIEHSNVPQATNKKIYVSENK